MNGAFEMSNATPPVAIDVLELLPLPKVDGLVERQVRGVACVWCAATLTTATAADLGPRPARRAGSELKWFPRGCRPCVREAAQRVLEIHVGTCEQCVDDPLVCDTATELRRLTLEGR
jgi:hypothetical protein